jgi:hypothetical protein
MCGSSKKVVGSYNNSKGCLLFIQNILYIYIVSINAILKNGVRKNTEKKDDTDLQKEAPLS